MNLYAILNADDVQEREHTPSVRWKCPPPPK